MTLTLQEPRGDRAVFAVASIVEDQVAEPIVTEFGLKMKNELSRRNDTRDVSPGRYRGINVFLRNMPALTALAFLGFVALVSITAPLFFPGNPLAIVGPANLWPTENWNFPLGTDTVGRDVLSGLAHGGQVSLIVGFAATLISLLIGLGIGAAAGYFGGLIDTVLSRFIEIFQTLPNFVVLVVLVAITNASVLTTIIAIGIISWSPIARLARAEFRSQRQAEFVVAARSLGFGHFRIIFSEILPNVLPSLIVLASSTIATAILMESALSFMGFGDPNVISWGSMIGGGRQFIRSSWYLAAIPGVAIVLTVLAINTIGDAINDTLNPHFLEGR